MLRCKSLRQIIRPRFQFSLLSKKYHKLTIKCYASICHLSQEGGLVGRGPYTMCDYTDTSRFQLHGCIRTFHMSPLRNSLHCDHLSDKSSLQPNQSLCCFTRNLSGVSFNLLTFLVKSLYFRI